MIVDPLGHELEKVLADISTDIVSASIDLAKLADRIREIRFSLEKEEAYARIERIYGQKDAA